MILTAIFFAAMAAGALVMFIAIVKSAIDDARGSTVPQPAPEARRIVLPGERQGRFVREGDRAPRTVAR
jgi:hypothetical protein